MMIWRDVAPCRIACPAFANSASMRRHSYHSLFAGLVCLLTLAASGDDFNLMCLLVPFRTTASSLPLDDPNTDSLAPVQSVTGEINQIDERPLTTWMAAAFTICSHALADSLAAPAPGASKVGYSLPYTFPLHLRC
jgi:hypothetical protein